MESFKIHTTDETNENGHDVIVKSEASVEQPNDDEEKTDDSLQERIKDAIADTMETLVSGEKDTSGEPTQEDETSEDEDKEPECHKHPDIENVKPSIVMDVAGMTITPPPQHVDTPRPPFRQTSFESPELRRRKPDNSEPRLPSSPCVTEVTAMTMEDDGSQDDSKPRLPSTPCVAKVETMTMDDTGSQDDSKPRLPSTPCVAEVETMTMDDTGSQDDSKPRLPSTPCVAEVKTMTMADTGSQNVPLAKPEAALCFALIMAASLFLAVFCLVRWLYWSDDGFVMLPVCFISIGLAMDNYRLYRGVLLGEGGLNHVLSTWTYVVEFSSIPLLWIALAEIFSNQTGWWLIPYPARILAVAFSVNGFNAFLSGPQGHYMVVSDGGVWRHTLDPFKVPFSLMIQPVAVAVTGLFLGFLNLCIHGDAASFLLQVVVFAGQALAAREPIRGQYVTNLLEVVYVGSLLYMYMIQT